MAIFKYPPTGSLHTTADGVHAFDLDSSGPDVLILGAGYFFIAEGLGAGGAVLNNTGAWTVTVNGSIVSKQTAGLWLLGGNPQVSTITIGKEGAASGTAGVTLDSSATLKNAGDIFGTQYGIHIRNAGARTIINSGTISGGTYAIYDENGLSSDTVSNSGTIAGTINLGGGNDKLTNWGTIDFLLAGDGNDTFINFKQVGTKVVSGIVTNGILLGDGDDRYLGGNRADSVGDLEGADTYKLGGGNDQFSRNDPITGTDSTDQVDGGKGLDLYRGGGLGPVYINLDTNGHSDTVFLPAQTAINSHGIDRITGFENASGGQSHDVIFGSATNNVLDGGFDGDDRLFGLAGNDRLIGGPGDDVLNGGRGKDILDGGADDDTFVYTSIKDSGVTKATRDVIVAVGVGFDTLDLSAIDAIATNAPGTNDHFTYIGSNNNFTGTAGQLRAYWYSNGFIVEADVNGDKVADFSVQIIDPDHVLAGFQFLA